MAANKGKHGSLGSKAFIMLTAAVIALSAAAVAISVNETCIMLDKFGQLEKGGPDAAASLKKDVSSSVPAINIKKAVRRPLFFNGAGSESLVCYGSGSDKYLLPIDIILENSGMPLNLLNPDDAFVSTVNGKKLVLSLGTGNASAGGVPVKLDTASLAAEGHVLVSPAILDYLDDFRFVNDPVSEAAFGYYWPSGLDKRYSNARLFALNGKKLQISDPFERNLFSYGENGPEAADEAVLSTQGDSVVARSGDGFYIINGKNYKKPLRLDVKGSWDISPGGGFLYRLDKTARSYYVYDIKTLTQKKFKDIYSPIKLESGLNLADLRLSGYASGSRFTRLDFEGFDGIAYTVISRSGKIVARGSSKYSPDRSRLLMYDAENGWCLSDPDGRNIIRFKDAFSAGWVDNDRIFLGTPGGNVIYDRSRGVRYPAGDFFGYVGGSEDTGLFFMKNNDLYRITDGKEKKITGLPWKCDYACSPASKGPVVVVSSEADVVFGISGDKILPLGITELFPNKAYGNAADAGFGRNAAFSPDGMRLAVLQKGDRFLELVLADFKGFKTDRLTLDFIPGDNQDLPLIGLKWLDNVSLAVYAGNRGWLADFSGKTTYLHEWSGEAAIMGVFQQAQ